MPLYPQLLTIEPNPPDTSLRKCGAAAFPSPKRHSISKQNKARPVFQTRNFRSTPPRCSGKLINSLNIEEHTSDQDPPVSAPFKIQGLVAWMSLGSLPPKHLYSLGKTASSGMSGSWRTTIIADGHLS
jgi:hypothetical protein